MCAVKKRHQMGSRIRKCA